MKSTVTQISPAHMLEMKELDLEIERLETIKSEFMADKNLPEWKKKQVKASLDAKKRQVQLTKKQKEYSFAMKHNEV